MYIYVFFFVYKIDSTAIWRCVRISNLWHFITERAAPDSILSTGSKRNCL